MAYISEEIESFIGNAEMSITDAMERIDQNAKGLMLICDANGVLEGCISDGDIRRWIIRTGDLRGSVREAMNPSPKWILQNETSVGLELMKRFLIRIIPVLDDKKRVVGVLLEDDLATDCIEREVLRDVPVFIMAGGEGTRLYPYTKILPKPLVPIGEIPIIERIMESFFRQGASHFVVSVNYKKDILKAYLNELKQYEIEYVEEDKPLGTAGSLKLAKGSLPEAFFVTNCDVLVKVAYDRVLKYHWKNHNDMTIVASLKKTVLPYGVLHTKEEGMVISVEEKPKQNYLINTGMYLLNTSCLDLIPDETCYHMTDLAEELLRQGRNVGAFPVSEDSFWDMGEFSELQRMEAMLAGKEV